MASNTRTATRASPRSADPIRSLNSAIAAEDWARAADQAIVLGRPGRDQLPDPMRPGFDAILEAFALYERGNDEPARDRLGVIGLSSPFLDWKLLVRGLIAYAAGDDDRALDNWGRLRPDGLPAQLAAPLRAARDPAYRAAQPATKQQRLRAAADRLRGGMLAVLRGAQSHFGRPERFPAALNHVATLLPRIRRDAPDLIPVLAQCCYAAAANGHPDGARLLKPVFDPPPEDPTFARLQALAAERRGEWAEANRHWERYQAVLAERTVYGSADRSRARALIWCRCGDNAVRHAGESPRALKPAPSAEASFRRAVQIDATLREGYERLFELYRCTNRSVEAMAVGQRLVELDPDNAGLLFKLSHLARQTGDLDHATAYLARARALNPLDRRLVEASDESLRARARARAIAGNFAGAAADLKAAEELGHGPSSLGLKCLRAAMAFRNGDAAGGNALAAAARAIDEPGACLALVAEAAHLKLPRAVRAPFDAALRAWLDGPTDIVAAIALAQVVRDQSDAQPPYYGYKGHAAKVRRYVERALGAVSSAPQAERLCEVLESLEWTKLLRKAAHTAAAQFPRDPVFPYYQARGLILDFDRGSWRAGRLLQQARRLAEALPAVEPRRCELLTRIAEAERQCDEPGIDLSDFIEMFDG